MTQKIEHRVIPKLGKPNSVAEYIDRQIQICGKRQNEIAEIAGFPKPNVITMIKQGKTPLPSSKIAGMAKALEVDKLHLLRLCMQEYDPALWSVISEAIGQTPLSSNELAFVETVRKAGIELPAMDANDVGRLEDFLKTIKAPD